MRFALLVDCRRISKCYAILLLESLWTESREAELVMLHFIRERQRHAASPDSKVINSPTFANRLLHLQIQD